MSYSKIILLVEVPVNADSLEAVKVLCVRTQVLTLAKPACKAFFQPSKPNDPTTPVFFEAFASQEASINRGKLRLPKPILRRSRTSWPVSPLLHPFSACKPVPKKR